jgi:hypothetical protein
VRRATRSGPGRRDQDPGRPGHGSGNLTRIFNELESRRPRFKPESESSCLTAIHHDLGH